MEDTEQNKTENPTPFKLHRAREKGAVARGIDLGFLTGISALLAYLWIAGPGLVGALGLSARRALVGGLALADGDRVLQSATATVFSGLARPLVLLFATVFASVFLFELVQTGGGVFSGERLKPDFSRLNPASGIKRLFSFRLLIEAFKNILKLAVYTTIAYLVIHAAFREEAPAITDGGTLYALLARSGLKLLSTFVLGAILFAVIDQLIVRRDFFRRMRMSRRELRREVRDREGEPRLKQKRKQLHREFVKASQSLRNVRKADVFITNPQRLALGLSYNPRTMHAPIVVCIGSNHVAQRLKRLAFLYSVPVVENRALARLIYAKTALNSPIPEECFKPVADIYNFVRRRSGQRSTQDAQDAVR